MCASKAEPGTLFTRTVGRFNELSFVRVPGPGDLQRERRVDGGGGMGNSYVASLQSRRGRTLGSELARGGASPRLVAPGCWVLTVPGMAERRDSCPHEHVQARLGAMIPRHAGQAESPFRPAVGRHWSPVPRRDGSARMHARRSGTASCRRSTGRGVCAGFAGCGGCRCGRANVSARSGGCCASRRCYAMEEARSRSWRSPLMGASAERRSAGRCSTRLWRERAAGFWR